MLWLLSTRPLTSILSFVPTFSLYVCIEFLYSTGAMCTSHYPVPWDAVDMTGVEPCKEVESERECIVNEWVHAI